MYGDCRQKDFFWGALTGGALATLSALFFLTKKGKQIQRQISDAYEEIEDSVKDTFASSKEKATEAIDQAGKKFGSKIKGENSSGDFR